MTKDQLSKPTSSSRTMPTRFTRAISAQPYAAYQDMCGSFDFGVASAGIARGRSSAETTVISDDFSGDSSGSESQKQRRTDAKREPSICESLGVLSPSGNILRSNSSLSNHGCIGSASRLLPTAVIVIATSGAENPLSSETRKSTGRIEPLHTRSRYGGRCAALLASAAERV